MGRIRTIKPDFCTSPSTSRLSRDARLFFLLLLTDVDDEGRFVASPKRLAGVLYPHDEDVTAQKVKKWRGECEREGMVRCYTVDGTECGQVVNFSKHQRVSHPTPSRIPPENGASGTGGPHDDFRPDLGSGIGSGSGSGNSSSSVSEEPPPQTSPEEDFAEQVLQALADRQYRENSQHVANPPAYRAKCLEEARAMHGPSLVGVFLKHPDLTVEEGLAYALSRVLPVRHRDPGIEIPPPPDEAEKARGLAVLSEAKAELRSA